LKPRNYGYSIEIKECADRVLNAIDKLDHDTAVILSNHILRLGEDPYTPRAGADIKKLTGSDPTTYRMRIGAQLRIEYTTNDRDHIVTIERIIPVKRRTSDYKI
jgi:mRNA-degrading endonuclease RelE of RelBE toxin-antitoxin system